MYNLKAEHEKYGTWYFTSQKHCGAFFECTSSMICMTIARVKGRNKYKKWEITPVAYLDDVPSAYINPDEKGWTHTKWIAEQENRYKELAKAANAIKSKEEV